MHVQLFNKWTLLTLSAILYALTFIIAALWWLIFVPFALLFYTMITYKLSFIEGLVWGTLFFSLQASGIFYSLFYMAQGKPTSFIMLVGTLFLLILYAACYSGIWFWSINFIKRYSTSSFLQLLLWVTFSWLYIFTIDQLVLWIFGSFEGYPLAHPLLPLASYPPFLTILPVFGKHILTGVFLASSSLLGALFLIKDSRKKLFVAIAALFPWLISQSLYHTSFNRPEWLSKIAILPESFYNPGNPARTIAEVAQRLKTLIQENPFIELIILPESALYLCDLFAHRELLKAWDQEHLSRQMHIITGALYKENTICSNAVYWIYDGVIQKFFCKKHALLLTERLPQWAHTSSLKQLYYKENKPFITPSCNKREPFVITPTLTFVPYICSEIFFKAYPDDIQARILSLCNDTWIEASYIKRLMQFMHRFRALEWQRTIVYVSYTHSYLYDAQGQQWTLKNTPTL